MIDEEDKIPMKELFELIYREQRWVKGRENIESLSGPGSYPSVVTNWLEKLKNLYIYKS